MSAIYDDVSDGSIRRMDGTNTEASGPTIYQNAHVFRLYLNRNVNVMFTFQSKGTFRPSTLKRKHPLEPSLSAEVFITAQKYSIKSHS